MTKEQDASTEDTKNPESKQTETSKKKPLTAYRKEGNLKKKRSRGWRGKHKFDLISLLEEFFQQKKLENMVRVRWWMKEHRFTMFPLLSNYARLSGKIDHITDIQVTKAQTKSIPVPCWEIHYSKVNSLHSVFPCAWFPPQTGHTACRGICWDMPPKCGLTAPRLQISWGTSSQRSFTDRVLNYIHLGQEGTLWIFSCNFQSRQEPDLMWLPTNHQLGFTYQEGQKVVWKTRERPAAVSTNIQWFNHTYAVNSTKKARIWPQDLNLGS